MDWIDNSGTIQNTFFLQESLLIGYDISASGPLRIFEIMKNGLLEFEIKIKLDTLEYQKTI